MHILSMHRLYILFTFLNIIQVNMIIYSIDRFLFENSDVIPKPGDIIYNTN